MAQRAPQGLHGACCQHRNDSSIVSGRSVGEKNRASLESVHHDDRKCGGEEQSGCSQGKKHLQSKGLTEDGLRESLKARLAVDFYLMDQGILKPEIPEENIRSTYESSPKSYSREETVRVSHILIAVREAEEKEAARQKVDLLRRELLEGRDFAEMAVTHSQCNSASGGGDLGYLKRGYMPEGFDAVAFTLKVNAVSRVVETKFGYHILKVADRKAAGVVPYGEVREFIEKFLQEKESKVKLAEHVAELRNKSKIEVLPRSD